MSSHSVASQKESSQWRVTYKPLWPYIVHTVIFVATYWKCVRSDDSYSDIWHKDIKCVANTSKTSQWSLVQRTQMAEKAKQDRNSVQGSWEQADDISEITLPVGPSAVELQSKMKESSWPAQSLFLQNTEGSCCPQRGNEEESDAWSDQSETSRDY